MMTQAQSARATDTTGWNFITEQDAGAALTHIRVVIRSGALSDTTAYPGSGAFHRARVDARNGDASLSRAQ